MRGCYPEINTHISPVGLQVKTDILATNARPVSRYQSGFPTNYRIREDKHLTKYKSNK